MTDYKCVILLTKSKNDRGEIIAQCKIGNDPKYIIISKQGIGNTLHGKLSSNTIIILKRVDKVNEDSKSINCILSKIQCSEIILAIHDKENGYEDRASAIGEKLLNRVKVIVNYSTASREVNEWVTNFQELIKGDKGLSDASSEAVNEKIICENKQELVRIYPLTFEKSRNFDNLFKKLWDIFSTSSKESTINHLLNLFLPLDIDMQALSIIHREVEEKKRDEKDVLNYLINSEEPEGMLRSKGKYEEKLTEKIQKNKKIESLLKKLEKFLKMLDEMKENVKNSKSEADAKNVIKKYLGRKDFWKKVEYFHKWYCDLAECLRGNYE